jgi:thiamine biosynthesis protein ThiS
MNALEGGEVVQVSEITLQVNGREKVVPSGLTVRGLLERLELIPATVVVEWNREILDRKRFGEVTLSDGDALEIVHFVGGG